MLAECHSLGYGATVDVSCNSRAHRPKQAKQGNKAVVMQKKENIIVKRVRRPDSVTAKLPVPKAKKTLLPLFH